MKSFKEIYKNSENKIAGIAAAPGIVIGQVYLFAKEKLKLKKMINDPASAKELTSIPNTFNIATPKNRKATISIPAVMVAVVGWICTPRFLRSSMIGKDPMMSITENRIMVTDNTAEIAIAHLFNYININAFGV